MPARALRLACLAAALAAVLLAPAAAGAKGAVKCKSGDLRYPFEPGGEKTFGVFKLKVAHGSCKTAHRVAKAWMKEFEDNLSAGSVDLPTSVEGFTFKSLPPHAAQTYSLRGRKGSKTIRFDYVVPNG